MAFACTKSYCGAICAASALGTCGIGCIATAFAGTVVGIAGAALGLAGSSTSAHFSSN